MVFYVEINVGIRLRAKPDAVDLWPEDDDFDAVEAFGDFLEKEEENVRSERNSLKRAASSDVSVFVRLPNV